jgi:hypothetical protein
MRKRHTGYSPAGRSEHVPDAHVLRSATSLPPLPLFSKLRYEKWKDSKKCGNLLSYRGEVTYFSSENCTRLLWQNLSLSGKETGKDF